MSGAGGFLGQLGQPRCLGEQLSGLSYVVPYALQRHQFASVREPLLPVLLLLALSEDEDLVARVLTGPLALARRAGLLMTGDSDRPTTSLRMRRAGSPVPASPAPAPPPSYWAYCGPDRKGHWPVRALNGLVRAGPARLSPLGLGDLEHELLRQ